MSGERTPDTTPQSYSGSSDDEISLREHIQRQLDTQRQTMVRMFDEFKTHYDTVLEERRRTFDQRIDDAMLLLNERFARQSENGKERWLNHERATETAFQSAQQATAAAFSAATQSIQTAHNATEAAIAKVEKALEERFASQARALDKAETATDKRFESVNEFRSQLNDQAHSFLPRSEAEVRFKSLIEKTESNGAMINAAAVAQQNRFSDLELRINKRLDTGDGRGAGREQLWGLIVGLVGIVGAVVAIAVAVGR